MKKIFILVSILGLLLFPVFQEESNAQTYNSVTFTTDTTINMSGLGVNLTVMAGSMVAGMTVSTSSISVDLMKNSVFQLRSSDNYGLENTLFIHTNHQPTYSEVILGSSIFTTVTITPQSENYIQPAGDVSGSLSSGQNTSPTPTLTPTPTIAPTPSVSPELFVLPYPNPKNINEMKSNLEVLLRQLDYLRNLLKQQTGLENKPKYNLEEKNLSFRDEGANVRNLQEMLAWYSDIYPKGIISGYFGPLTQAAVKLFQKKYEISQTGTVGPLTRAKLKEIFK
ncbi:MAG TPA: peptidoglycan-binding domain-containing protein [Candidatus Paceibacterota bacterium]|nr:peptidoglycan-binding domain-containing protein [Candidatus Paceibacterota bacterium]